MVKRVVTVGFIGVVAVAGIVVGTRSTVADGRVMAADMLEQARKTDRRVERIECDRAIPIGTQGAKFRCRYFGGEGSTALVEFTMDRAGSLAPRVVEQTGPTRPEPATE